MAAQNFTDFTLTKDAYAAFDAVSMKSLIIQRLKNSGVFTDQVYEGSNLSALIDIIAYSYHVTLFYLNNQAAESYFSQATLFENLNKIVNLIGYNPVGSQTSIATIDAVATANLNTSNYIIPRFSFVVANGVFYSLASDVYFEKSIAGQEAIDSIGSQNLLYQGQFKEYPTQSALGEQFEILTIAVESIITNANSFIDYNNIFVFVQDATTQIWSEWVVTNSLFNAASTAKVFEKRLNDSGRYELKFGDGVNGKQLNANDQIAIYYLQSDGADGIIAAQTLLNNAFVRFTTPRFSDIAANLYSSTDPVMTQDQLNCVLITNTNKSTDPKSLETVEEIRSNAPKIFAAQSRAVTTADFNAFTTNNFSNLVLDVQALSNSDYIDSYIKYFYDIGLKQPNQDSRVLMNQVNFADACDFNNVYLFLVPRNFIIDASVPQALPTSLKQLIINSFKDIKLQNMEVIPSDPVYIAIDVAASALNEIPDESFRNTSAILVKKSPDSRISTAQIKNNVYNTILNFFALSNLSLGMTIDIFTLTKNVLALPGVNSISTVRVGADGSVIESPGFSFVLWNPQYSQEDITIATQNISLPKFKYPFFAGIDTLFNKISVA